MHNIYISYQFYVPNLASKYAHVWHLLPNFYTKYGIKIYTCYMPSLIYNKIWHLNTCDIIFFLYKIWHLNMHMLHPLSNLYTKFGIYICTSLRSYNHSHSIYVIFKIIICRMFRLYNTQSIKETLSINSNP